MKPQPSNGKKENVAVELLLHLTRPAANDEAASYTCRLPQESPDWDYLIELADRHRVVPVLYNRLAAFSRRVPEPPLTDLRQRARSISFNNLALTARLLKLLELFRRNGIPALAYKGPALAQSAYGDLRLRQFTDLDILVRKQDVYKIKELLIARNYRAAWSLSPAQEAAVLRHYYEYSFLCDEPRMLIEIHWEFAERFFSFGFDLDQIRSRAQALSIQGKMIQTLSPEDSLLVLCAHGGKHLWQRLNWISDVAQTVVRHRDLDWDILFQRATQLGLRRILWLGLFLASDLLGAELPAEVSRKILAEPKILGLAAQIRQGLFRSDGGQREPLRTALFHLSTRERVRDKFSYSFRLLVLTKLIDSLFMPMGRPR